MLPHPLSTSEYVAYALERVAHRRRRGDPEGYTKLVEALQARVGELALQPQLNEVRHERNAP